MINSSKLIVGLAGVVHPNMPGKDKELYKKMIEEFKKLKEKLDFELISINEPLETEEAGRTAKKTFEDKDVDFTMIFNASLGFGRVILPLAKINSYLGLWSVPEPNKEGVLKLNSFCGLNMYGSIIEKYFKHDKIPFKWFYGEPSSDIFLERFKITLKAIKAIKTVKNSRIGLIGGIANGFENMYFDERDLINKFGTFIQARHTVEDIVSRAKTLDDQRVKEDLKEVLETGQWNKDKVNKTELEKSSRVFLALKDFANENKYNALAISCWPKFQEIYGIAVCSAMSRLNDIGIITTCEGDVPGTINQIVLSSISGQRTTVSDLVALDEEDQSVNLWHCGVAPPSMADSNSVCWNEHFNIGSYVKGDWQGKGTVADLKFKPGKITIFRMDSSFDDLFIMTGDFMKEKKGYYGSSGWINNLRINEEKVNLRDLMNTLLVNRVDHHYPLAYGDLSNELFEFANWLNLNILDIKNYRPYMQNYKK